MKTNKDEMCNQTTLERDALWVLLDDIDSASDAYKTDYKGFAKAVYGIQQIRHKVCSGDKVDVGAARAALRACKNDAPPRSA